MRGRLDWVDIILHGVGSLLLVGAFWVLFRGLLPVWTLFGWAVIVSMVWMWREYMQDVVKGVRPPWPFRRSSQKDWEFRVPAIVALLTAAALAPFM